MPVVWRNRGYFEDEKGLFLKRINPPGQHDPQQYYYLWEAELNPPFVILIPTSAEPR